MPFLRGNSPKRLAVLDRKQEMFSNVGRGRECRPLHVAPLPAFVMVSVICCYYGLLFEKSESIASTRKSGSSRVRGWSTVSASGGSGCNERTGGEDSSHRIERAMSMAECKQAVLVEKETAHRDCLTGCYDRMTIQHLVDLCFLKSDVRQSHAMFVIDVDNFKRVNDTWGREFGDIVLNDVAAVLRRIFRRSDYIGRIGDDEFLVLLRDVEPERLSEKKAQEFYTALGTLFSARGDERYKPTCSVGIARYPMDGTLFETVFQSADAALHEAKRLGLNRVAFAPGCEGRKR